MPYQLFTTPAAERALKHLARPVRQYLVGALEVLATEPYTGAQLEPPWRFLRSYHLKYQNVQYRVVYEVNEQQQHILVRYAASRENFYQELKRLQLKALTP